MALKTFVKISDISNLSDARYCAGMGVDVLGFRLDPNDPNSVDTAKFKSITEWIAGVGFAGEFYQSDVQTVKEVAKRYHLSYLQIIPANFTHEIIDLKIPLIIEVKLVSNSSEEGLRDFMTQALPHVEFFLIHADDEALAENFLPTIKKLSTDFPLLLGCGITQDNINEIIATSSIKGIGMKGSEEIKPGFKDYDELADILQEIEEEV